MVLAPLLAEPAAVAKPYATKTRDFAAVDLWKR